MTKSFVQICIVLAYLAMGTPFAKAEVNVAERARQEACLRECKVSKSVCIETPSTNRMKNWLWCGRQLKTCRALCRGGQAERGWGWWGR